MSQELLNIAAGIPAGKLTVLVGSNGVPLAVTSEGLISAIDDTVRNVVEHSTYGNQALYDILSTGGVSIDLDAIIEDLGNPSIRTNLTSIEDIIGWQDVVSVQPIADVLGAGSAGRYKTSGSLGADMSTIIDSRLTSARAGYLDNLSAGAVALAANQLSNTIWTSARAGYLDNINNADLPNITLTNINTEVDNALDTAIVTPTTGSIAERIKALDDNYTVTRAGYLDNLSGGAVALASSALSTVDWTSLRAGYLDELSSGNIPTDVDTLLSRLSATRAADLDYIEASAIGTPVSGSIAERIQTLDDNFTVTRAGYLDNINNADLPNITLANINTEVDNALDTALVTPTTDSIAERIKTLDDNYTITRAGYLDNLSGGAVALASSALSDVTWSDVRAGYLDELATANIPTDVDTLLTRLSATRAADLDYIEASAIGTPVAGSIAERVKTLDDNFTATRAGYLDNINNADLPNITLANINTEVDSALDTVISTPTADSIAERIKTIDDNYTTVRAGYLDELSSANIPTDVDTLLTRLSALRAGYLDELDFDLTARLGIPAGASLSADILTLDNTINSVTIGLSKVATELSGAGTSGTHAHAATTTEQDVIEITQTNIYSILSLWIDLTNFTTGRVLTVRIYAKIDGTTYRKIDEVDYTAGTHDSVSVAPMLNQNHNIKLTMQIDVAETGSINAPYRYVLADFT